MVKYLINRPIAVTAIFLSILVVGFYGFVKIPVNLLPSVDPPEISIEVRKNGFSPEIMERTVLSTIRQSVIGSYGLKNVESEATQGFGAVGLSYEFGTNMDLALIEINEKIDRIISSLPSDVERPIVKKKKPTDIPVLRVHLASDVFSISELSQIVRFEISKRFEQVIGVAQIETNGTVQKSIQLIPKMDKIIAAGLDLNEITSIVQRSNMPIGQVLVKDGNYEYLVQIENIIRDKSTLESLIVRTGSGQQVELSELFDINEYFLNPLNRHLFNGKQGLVIAIYNQPQVDLFEMQADLNETLNQLKQEFPSIHFTHSQDQVDLLRSNIDQLYITSGLAALFAFIVFFISSKNRRLPLILGTVIPSSILIAIGTLWVMGFTLNIITLSGFILGIGLLVDNVIILIEEINQNRAAGFSVKDSCIKSVQNIFPALLSSTLTTICVFIPLLALEGIASELFKEQAISLIVILGVSLTLTFILIPTFYSLWIKKEVHDLRWISILRERSHKYSVLSMTIFVSLIILAGSYSAIKLSSEDLPSYSSSDFEVQIIWNEPISLEENTRRVRQIIQDLDPQFISADIGISDITTNDIDYFDEANLYINTDTGDVKGIRDQILNKTLDMYPNATVSHSKAANPFEMIFFDNQPPSEARIRKNNSNFFTKSELESLTEVSANGTLNLSFNKSYKIEFLDDRIQNSSLAYPVLLEHLKNLTDENVITSLKNPDQSIPLAIVAQEMDYFINLDSTYLDLSTFYRVKDTIELRKINADLSGPYVSFTSAKLSDAESFGKKITNNQNWIYDLRGKLLDSAESIKKLVFAGLLGAALLYLILVAQFESFKQPLIIFSMAPLALLGSLVALYSFGATINIMSIIGIVVTLGIIVNDSILKIDAINRNIKAGHEKSEAIAKAKNERFKPILMTSLSTILALLPVLISSGIASDLQKPLALVVIGGLIVGTWSSIYLLPIVYRLTSKE